ncbi:MAG: hypothetical protein J2P29_17545 [Actinobacteria bacterium]|nr:hypothetical protein [Actinomycetota bacterium]
MRLTRITFIAGFAAGFLAGARSGKETYDQIIKYAQQALEHPTVQQARGTVQTQATGLAQKVGGQIADRMPQVAQSAKQTVGTRIPGMRSKSGQAGEQDVDSGAYAATGGTSRPGPDLTR